jgi:superoxide dismutase, Cu-Zn family
MKHLTWFAAGALLFALAAQRVMAAETAHAELKNAEGKAVGTATLEQTSHGVLMTVDVTNLPAGTHAFHIHAVGKCEPPFTSAGGHFNPTGRQHGIKNPKGMHAGDLPNIYVPENGKLKFDVLAKGVSLGKGKNGLFHKDGTSLVVHAGPDDYKTDPAGDAGARIACGVITK